MSGATTRLPPHALRALAAIAFLAGAVTTAAAQSYPHESDLIEIMFASGSQVRLRGGRPTDLAAGARAGAGALSGIDQILAPLAWREWHRQCPVSEARLDAMQAEGERRSGGPVYNLNNIYRLRVPAGTDIVALSAGLEALPGVLLARPVPLPQPQPVPPYEPFQGYLYPASYTPTGTDAQYAWTQPGGDGTGVTVCDVEYSWNYNHDDITKAVGSQIRAGISDPFGSDHHGTAVIGVLVADQNGWGTTGACHGASLLTCGTFVTATGWDVAGAIALAASSLSPGDVILVEQQWDYTGGGGYVPIEWWLNTTPAGQSYNAVYAAITNAVANGINVVETGGNGTIDTDLLSWYPVSSGAIVVGGGGVYTGGTWSGGDLQRLSYSSYGTRFDLQGWGENVYTTGYGTLYSAEGYDRYYRADFDGTSSAGPVVAAAVASCVGYWLAKVSPTPPTPAYVRNLLVTTGTPQVTPPAGNIGPRPDLLAAIAAMPVPSPWTDVSPAALTGNLNSKGVAWGDFDGDGDPDLYVTRVNIPNRLLRNDAGTFNEVTPSVVQDAGASSGAAWGDFDRDGDLDLYLLNFGQANKLFRNDGGGVFADVTAPPLDHTGSGTSTAWADYDNDGDVDLYFANYNAQANRLLRNDGAGVFADVTTGDLADLTHCLCVAWGDCDEDGDPDLYLSNYNGQANQLLRNDGGAFADVPGVLSDMSNGTSAAWGDYDNDGDLDLYTVNYNSQPNHLFRNDGAGAFVDVTTGPLLDPYNGEGATWGDYDNDGDLDLYLVNNPGANRLLRNDGGGVFVDDTSGPLADAGGTQGAAWADYDGDGDLDLCFANYGTSDHLVRNDIANGNHWLQVDLKGQVSNTSGVGARIRVVTGSRIQWREVGTGAGYCAQNALTGAFGLGSATLVDTVEVRWPSGGRQSLMMVAVDKRIVFDESTLIGVEEPPAERATFALHACAPNPARPATVIRYDLPRTSRVELRIHDTAGRLVRVLERDRTLPAGRHAARWDGADAAGRTVRPGVYFVRLEAGPFHDTGRILVLE